MMGWVFSGITLVAVFMTSFDGNMKRSIFALWVAGLGVGAIYLTIGAEFLAMVQWVVSTLVTISFVFFSVMFGEYKTSVSHETSNPWVLKFFALVLGLGFAGVIGVGTQNFSLKNFSVDSGGADLALIGQKLTQENLLSLEVLALTLFLVVVGAGVIARSEKRGL
ncbi:MAG: NADH-quinone oxidoreductase subunit J [Bdellovibrionia bacterium]